MIKVFGAFTRALRDADLEKCEEYLRRHPGRQRQGIVSDLQIGTALYELKGIRSDRSHTNYNGAQVTGVKKRAGVKIPMEIQKQAVDLDEKMFGVAAPAVGQWQRQLNELGGVKPLAFGQYGELGPGFEQLLDQLAQLAEEGADEAAKRYLIPNRVVAKGVQLRLLRQRVVMTAQNPQADVLLHRLHYALPGWDAAAERRGDAHGEFHSAAQARAWADGDCDADHGFAVDGVGRPAH
jgi:hypothetical protein